MLNGKTHPKGRPKQGRGGNKAGGEGRRNLDDQQILSTLLPSIINGSTEEYTPQLKGWRGNPEKTFFIRRMRLLVSVTNRVEALRAVEGGVRSIEDLEELREVGVSAAPSGNSPT